MQAACALWCPANWHTASGQLLGRYPELGEDARALWCALPVLHAYSASNLQLLTVHDEHLLLLMCCTSMQGGWNKQQPVNQ